MTSPLYSQCIGKNPKTLMSFTVIEDQQRMQPTATNNQLQQEKSRSFSLFIYCFGALRGDGLKTSRTGFRINREILPEHKILGQYSHCRMSSQPYSVSITKFLFILRDSETERRMVKIPYYESLKRHFNEETSNFCHIRLIFHSSMSSTLFQ